jgi:TRAP-type C4-dicarboxylate transport system permease small subunit
MSEETRKKEGWIGRIVGGGGALGYLGMGFMVVSITYDVILRYFFAAPTNWALEVNTFLLVFLCVIPAADVLKAGVQIRITFLTERLPLRTKERLDILRAIAGVLFCAVMAWKGAVMALHAWQHNDRMSTSLGTPMVIPYLFLPIGFALLGLQYLTFIKKKGKKTGKMDARSSGRREAEIGQQI